MRENNLKKSNGCGGSSVREKSSGLCLNESFLVLFVLISGCGVESYGYECTVPGLKQYTSQSYIDCDLVRAEVKLAFDIINETGIVNDGNFGDLVIRVEDTGCISGSGENGETCYAGFYYSIPSNNIVLNNDRLGLLHEMLHQWDAVHLNAGTCVHMFWDTNRYFAVADGEYHRRLRLLRQDLGVEVPEYVTRPAP